MAIIQILVWAFANHGSLSSAQGKLSLAIPILSIAMGIVGLAAARRQLMGIVVVVCDMRRGVKRGIEDTNIT